MIAGVCFQFRKEVIDQKQLLSSVFYELAVVLKQQILHELGNKQERNILVDKPLLLHR